MTSPRPRVADATMPDNRLAIDLGFGVTFTLGFELVPLVDNPDAAATAKANAMLVESMERGERLLVPVRTILDATAEMLVDAGAFWPAYDPDFEACKGEAMRVLSECQFNTTAAMQVALMWRVIGPTLADAGACPCSFAPTVYASALSASEDWPTVGGVMHLIGHAMDTSDPAAADAVAARLVHDAAEFRRQRDAARARRARGEPMVDVVDVRERLQQRPCATNDTPDAGASDAAP